MNINDIRYSPIPMADGKPRGRGSSESMTPSPSLFRQILAKSPFKFGEMTSEVKSPTDVSSIATPSLVVAPSPAPEEKMAAFAKYTKDEEMTPVEKAVVARYFHKHIPEELK